MMFYTHLASGFLAGLYLMGSFSNKALFLGLLLVGVLLPDLDSPYSKLGRKVKPISKLLEFLFGHRGVFHSLMPAILLLAVFYFILEIRIAGIALFAGFVLHLVLDGLTKEGVNYLYPFAKFRMSGFIRTGGVLELIIFFALLGWIFVKVVL